MKALLKDKEGVHHPVENVLIAVQSKVLRKIFQCMKPSEVLSLPSIKGEILQEIICWIHQPYLETLNLDISEGFFVSDLLIASEFLDIPILSRQIISWLARQLNSENVLDLWIFSRQYLVRNLEVLCWQFLMKHLDIIKPHQLDTLEENDVLAILTSDELRFKEEFIWDLVQKLRRSHKLMESVRFGLLGEKLWKKIFRSAEFRQFLSESKSPSLLRALHVRGIKPRTLNDLVFLFGAFSVSVMDPSSGASVNLPVNLPSGFTPEIAVVGTEIFLVGGHMNGAGQTNSLLKLSLENLSLSSLSRMKVKRVGHAVAKLGQFLYVVGGSGSKSGGSVERYDLLANQWEDCESMNEMRFGPGIAALDGKLFVVGGQCGNSISQTVEVFDPHQGTWTYTTPMIKRRCKPGCTSVYAFNSKLYVVGGWGKRRSRRKSCEVFDPVTKVWTEVPKMNEARAECSLFVANNHLMVAGGSGSGVSMFEVLEKKKWIAVQHRNVAGQFGRAVSVPVDDLSKEAFERFRNLLCYSS